MSPRPPVTVDTSAGRTDEGTQVEIAELLARAFVDPEPRKIPRPEWTASYLRSPLELRGDERRVTLAVTALGSYRLSVNGTPASERLFAPGFTNYAHRLQYQLYDLTDAVIPGENTVAVVLANGWYRGWSGAAGGRGENFPVFGRRLALAIVAEVEDADGGIRRSILTDTATRATQQGPIGSNDMRGGEHYDARREQPGWDRPGFDDAAWHPVRPSSYRGELIPDEGLPVLEHEQLTPTLLTTPDGSRVLDFGQNFAGQVRFTTEAESGTVLTLIHGETLDEHGDFTQKNLVEGDDPDAVFGQVVRYTAAGGHAHYQPSTCYMGFRYVKLEGFPAEASADDFRGIAIYSDLTMNGEFSCSVPELDRLVENTRWSFRSNAVDIPTDCPTREHSGWTGDAQVFSDAAHWLADAGPFWRRWMREVAAQQTAAGRVSCIVPDANPSNGAFIDGAAGWADAIGIVPLTMYRFSGDLGIIREFFPHVRRWVEFTRRRARRSNVRNLAKTGAHRRFIVDTGYQWGEWLEPGADLRNIVVKNMFFPDAEVATAYFAHSAGIASRMAGLLGDTAAERELWELRENVAAAYRTEFLADGLPTDPTRQARFVRPIALDLVPQEGKVRLAAALAELVREGGYRLGTGFLSTGLILQALSDHGQTETAYRLLENPELPGWLYPVRRGATSIWENWDGIDEAGVPHASLNHYSKGAVVAWLFRGVAGLDVRPDGSVAITPQPGGSLEWARGSYRLPTGRVESGWTREASGIRYHVTIPAGVTATVTLPGRDPVTVAAGEHEWLEATA
ncbi:MAG: alpha-L-rhamnosidase [Leifsonia xyli]|nr:MAG: alpha-L-rhamnosidase [Leifsonia xyli]